MAIDAALFENPLFSFLVWPLVICLSRVADVTFSTLRIIFIAKGQKFLASVMGFCEMLIWVTVMGTIMTHIQSPIYYVAYALGFAFGNYIGVWLEEKIALGVVGLRIITRTDANELVDALQKKELGITSVDAQGAKGPVKVIYMVINRQVLDEVISTIKSYNPKAFYSVEDIRFVNEGVFPPTQGSSRRNRFAKRFRNKIAKKK